MEYTTTPHGTNRLFLNLSKMPKEIRQQEALFAGLNMFSIGFYDSLTDRLSWEFDAAIPEETIRIALARVGYKLD